MMTFKFLVRLHGEYNILVYSFVETPRKFIIAIINLCGISTKLDKNNDDFCFKSSF